MPLLAHDPEALKRLRRPSNTQPLRILVSGCLAGQTCGVDGTDYGMGSILHALLASPRVRPIHFCPEDFVLGTPRPMPDIHGGAGRDVLEGRAKILGPEGQDLTHGMVRGAKQMLACALEHRVELAILTDMSAACGSQVISDGCRSDKPRRYRKGVGVAAALLLDHGIAVVSQRDWRTLDHICLLVGLDPLPQSTGIDHHDTEWYRKYFSSN